MPASCFPAAECSDVMDDCGASRAGCEKDEFSKMQATRPRPQLLRQHNRLGGGW